MRIATLIAVLALLCVTTAYADKVPEAKDWSHDLSGLRNIAEVEPNDVCPGQEIVCGDVVDAYLGDGDVDFFTFYLTAGTVLTIGTDAGPDPDAYDTQLTLYDADCVNELAYNDDGGPGFYSLITYEVLADGYYTAMVNPYPYTTPYVGNYVLFVTCEAPQEPPVNDTCDGAIAIDRCTTGVIEGDLTWANNDYDTGPYPNDCTNFPSAGKDVAYVMNLEAGDVVDLFHLGDCDESLYIVTDCGDVAASCVIGVDATVGTGETIAGWVAPATGTYFVIVDCYGTDNGGPFTLTYTIDCPVTPNESMTWGKVKSMFE